MAIRTVELSATDLPRIGEIDRSETISFEYAHEDGRLIRRPAELQARSWSPVKVARLVGWLEPKLSSGGAIWGALDGPRLVGVSVLSGEFLGADRDQLQLAFLHVSNGYRRRGIARMLMKEACDRARSRGARQLYISATPSESAIGFYLSHGCRLAAAVDPALYAEEPLDIHLTLDL